MAKKMRAEDSIMNTGLCVYVLYLVRMVDVPRPSQGGQRVSCSPSHASRIVPKLSIARTSWQVAKKLKPVPSVPRNSTAHTLDGGVSSDTLCGGGSSFSGSARAVAVENTAVWIVRPPA